MSEHDEPDPPMRMDGFDEAIVGIGERCGLGPVIVYDKTLVLQILRERDGMSDEDAEEHYQYNMLGSWVGDGTPMIVHLMPAADVLEYFARYEP